MPLAFDPDFTYTPWQGYNNIGLPYGNQTFTNAQQNPYFNAGTSVNLSDHFYFEPDADGNCPTDFIINHASCISDELVFGDPPVFGDPNDVCKAPSTMASEMHGDPEVGLQSAQINYANWFSYYRARHLTAKKALSEVISVTDAKVGLATFHNNENPAFLLAPMTEGDNRNELLARIGRINPTGGTPLRRQLDEAGRYFQSADLSVFNLPAVPVPVPDDDNDNDDEGPTPTPTPDS